MLDVSWAPMLGAFSVLFEEYGEGNDSVLHIVGLGRFSVQCPSMC